MMRFGMLSLIALMSALSGCATPAAVSLQKGLLSDAAEKGWVVGSIGFTPPVSPRYAVNSLIFRRIGARDSGSITAYNNGAPEQPLNDGDFSGVAFQVELPAGKYEIFRVKMGTNAGTVYFGSVSPEDFSIPFEVKANTKSYLGRFVAKAEWSKSTLGFQTIARSYFEVSDHFLTDSSAMGLDLSKTEKNVVAPDDRAKPFIHVVAP